jgi:hypothetical protein
MPEPKPCPVCGGTEFGVEFDETDNGMIVAFLICEECDEDDDTRGPVGKPRDTEEEAEEEALRAWNRLIDEVIDKEEKAGEEALRAWNRLIDKYDS